MEIALIIAVFIVVVFFDISIMINTSRREKELRRKEEELDKQYKEWLLNGRR